MIEIKRCHHMSRIPTKFGEIVIGVFCGSFGEPNGTVDVSVDVGKGLESLPLTFVPEYAILIGREISERAKQARAQRKRWERRDVAGYVKFVPEEIDIEDRGEWVNWQNKPEITE